MLWNVRHFAFIVLAFGVSSETFTFEDVSLRSSYEGRLSETCQKHSTFTHYTLNCRHLSALPHPVYLPQKWGKASIASSPHSFMVRVHEDSATYVNISVHSGINASSSLSKRIS